MADEHTTRAQRKIARQAELDNILFSFYHAMINFYDHTVAYGDLSLDDLGSQDSTALFAMDLLSFDLSSLEVHEKLQAAFQPALDYAEEIGDELYERECFEELMRARDERDAAARAETAAMTTNPMLAMSNGAVAEEPAIVEGDAAAEAPVSAKVSGVEEVAAMGNEAGN